MNESLVKATSKLTPISLGGACVRLVLAVAGLCLLVGALGYAWHGAGGVLAAVVAVLICGVGAALTLLATGMTHGPQRGMYAILFAMMFGFAVPLAVGFMLDRRGGALAEGGLFGLMVISFELTLVVQTWLVVRLVQMAHGVAEPTAPLKSTTPVESPASGGANSSFRGGVS